LLGIDSIAPSQASGTTTYYATQVVAGCEGAASAVDVTEFPTPPAPVTSSDTLVCFGTYSILDIFLKK
jgi:hypothetical protein